MSVTGGINVRPLVRSTAAKCGLLPSTLLFVLTSDSSENISERCQEEKQRLFLNATVTPEMTFGLPFVRKYYFGSAVIRCHIVRWSRKARPQRKSICLPFPLLLPRHVLLPPRSAHLLGQSLTVYTNASLQQQSVSAWTDQAHQRVRWSHLNWCSEIRSISYASKSENPLVGIKDWHSICAWRAKPKWKHLNLQASE